MARGRLESYNKTWLGLIAVTVVGVIVGAMLIANAANVGHRHYTAKFLQAAALQTGNPITIGGHPGRQGHQHEAGRRLRRGRARGA